MKSYLPEQLIDDTDKKILLVDDDKDFLELLSRYVASFGYEFETAEDGEQALEKILVKKCYSVVITDMMMPNMDGMELIIHLNNRVPALDIIVLTGYSKTYTFTDVISAGATDFIEKPINKEELKAKLKRVFRERQTLVNYQQEIEERKKAQEALLDSERTFRAITGTAQYAIVMMNSQGKITYWNPAARRMFGYSDSEVIGQDLHKMLPPARYGKAYEASLEKFKKPGYGMLLGKTVEVPARHKDGSEFQVELSISGLEIKRQWHAVGIISDISGRYSPEKEKIDIPK